MLPTFILEKEFNENEAVILLISEEGTKFG
jgi:hypothetical protein